MNYKKKFRLLTAAAVLLILIYTLTFVFDRGRAESRRSSYTWINRGILESADRIEITGMAGPVILERKNNVWVMPLSSEGVSRDYPVRQSRVEDLFNALSRRSSYPLRSISGGIERLSLGEDMASGIRVRGGAGLPLLDILIGFGKAVGSTVYLRRAGSSEARSGEDIFSVYTETGRKPWLDLSLFQNVSIENIQRVRVQSPEEQSSFILSRSGREWIFSSLKETNSGTGERIERIRAESYLRSIINTEAEDFCYHLKKDASVFAGTDSGSVTLEIGDGSFITLRAGTPDENGNRPAVTNNSDLVYSLTKNTLDRLFPIETYFAKPDVDN